jgi:hypothetical protein
MMAKGFGGTACVQFSDIWRTALQGVTTTPEKCFLALSFQKEDWLTTINFVANMVGQ